MRDVASRLAFKVQLTTDGLHFYVDAVDSAFGIDVDYGMIQKHYGRAAGGGESAAVRYSLRRSSAPQGSD